MKLHLEVAAGSSRWKLHKMDRNISRIPDIEPCKFRLCDNEHDKLLEMTVWTRIVKYIIFVMSDKFKMSRTMSG